MKKLSMLLLVSAFAIFLAVGSAGAAIFGSDGGTMLQGVLDDITILPTPGVSSVNVTTDDIADNFDSYWNITGGGGSVSTLVIELGSYAPHNIFGLFDSTNPSNFVNVFQGSDVSGAQAIVSITPTGDVFLNYAPTGVVFGSTTFGYFLDATYYGPGRFWYSDTSVNSDGMDHMYAYRGKNIDTVQIASMVPSLWTSTEYVLAFEDLRAVGSDRNYSDMVIMVQSVKPVPVPATLLLFGSGLLGLIGIRRKVR